MTTSLIEVLGTRRRRAAERAVEAADDLADGLQWSPDVQGRVEDALGDLAHYSSMHEALASLASDLGLYRRGGASLLRDMWSARSGDKAAATRLVTHARSTHADTLHETRDIGGGSVWATVPTWLVTDAAPMSTNVAPLVRMLAKPLPVGTSGSVNLLRWSTEPTAAAQNGMGGALPTPTIADGTSGPVVKTFGVRAKMSIQLLEQGRPGIDAQLLPVLIAACDAKINDSILNGDGTAGAVLGIRSTPNITTASYTDSTPTLAEAWPAIEGAVRTCEIGMGGSPVLVIHPRRLSWFRQRSIVESVSALAFDSPTLPGATTRVLGSVEIVTDPNIATTLGVSTSEDVVIVMRSTADVDLFLGPPRVQFGNVDGLQVFVNVWREVAFTAGRLPASLGVVSGTGWVAPTP